MSKSPLSNPARKEQQQDGRGTDLAQETWEGSQSTGREGSPSLHFLLCSVFQKHTGWGHDN